MTSPNFLECFAPISTYCHSFWVMPSCPQCGRGRNFWVVPVSAGLEDIFVYFVAFFRELVSYYCVSVRLSSSSSILPSKRSGVLKQNHSHYVQLSLFSSHTFIISRWKDGSVTENFVRFTALLLSRLITGSSLFF